MPWIMDTARSATNSRWGTDGDEPGLSSAGQWRFVVNYALCGSGVAWEFEKPCH